MNLKDKNLYYVGGVVRDEILGTTSFDTDYCYEGDAIEFSKGMNVIKENPAFGTVRILLDNKEIDIASTREEIYPKPGHLPEVRNIGCPLKDDLKRRDFTINALAKNTLTNEITDYFGGVNDIQSKTLRVLHNRSFIDDPTRIVRGLKFSVRFGFELDSHTKKLQEEYLTNINYDMSYHRLKKELKETFNLNKREALEKFVEQGIYKLLGESQKTQPIPQNIEEIIREHKIESPWILYLGRFDLSILDLTRQERKILEWYERLKTQSITNNTPKESIIMREIWGDL